MPTALEEDQDNVIALSEDGENNITSASLQSTGRPAFTPEARGDSTDGAESTEEKGVVPVDQNNMMDVDEKTPDSDI